MKASSSSILLTGVPRSGTTLTCYLLNKLSDTVALNEPLPVRELGKPGDYDVIYSEIARHVAEIRRSLLESGTAISKHVDGCVPDDPFDSTYPNLVRRFVRPLLRWHAFGRGAGRGRRLRVTRGVIAVEKQLSSDFLLCVKHPAAFTALLAGLVDRFRCYAIIRNPLSVLASWNSCQMHMWNGHSPTAEYFDPGLGQALAQLDNRFDRQLHLLSWFFGKYNALLPPKNILRYEDIVASGGAALEIITARSTELNETLENRNANRLYDRQLARSLGIKLLQSDGPFWNFYSRDSIERVLGEITK